MPAPRIKKEKGHHTSITNLKDIARAIRFPSECLLKYLGYELGFRVSFKESLLSGCCDVPTIINCLDKLIRSYLLCPKCQYPEVILKSRQKVIVRDCQACGSKTTIDTPHKINAEILKSLESVKQTLSHPSPNSEDLTKVTHGSKLEDACGINNSNFEEEKKEMEYNESFSDLETGSITKAREYYQQYESATDKSMIVKEVINKMKSEAADLKKIPFIFFNGMFDINIAKNIGKNESLIKMIYQELQTPEPELDLLLNLESFLFVKNNKKDFEKYVATILKLFWDEDLFSDEFICDWDEGRLDKKFMKDWRYQKSVDEEFKQAARPFIDWTKNSEEDE